jgi:hypothetical protein
MQPLYTARDRIEAQLVHDHLDRHLIRTTILGDYLAGAFGELPADLSPSVWLIDDEDLGRARDLIDRFLAEQTASPNDGEPWHCPSCGETVEADFDLCWNCARPRHRG